MGCPTLLIVNARRSGVPRHQLLRLHCASHVVGDERRMVFYCAALQMVRKPYIELFRPAIVVEQSMRQGDLVRVAHLVLDCCELLHGWVVATRTSLTKQCK